jgi:uncharacterized protein (TIGR04255 family)
MNGSDGNIKFEHFERAPIILSILQFRYKTIENFNSDRFKEKGKLIKSDYSEIRERYIQQIHFTGNKPDGTTNVSLDDKKIDGVQLISKDKKKNLVIGEDRFTYEMHGNYSGWEKFSTEARKLWELFQDELGGIHLTGLSLRYINRINLPGDFHDISDYFTTFIQSSSGEHMLNTFQLKYTTTEPENNMTIHVGHVLEPPIEGNYPYLFDIDVIYSSDIQNDSSAIWEIFNTLRFKKNYIFNDGLTEKSKNIIR